MNQYLLSLVGGMMIGLSAISFLILTGRIAGISGIAGRLLQGRSPSLNAPFLAGLFFGPLIYRAAAGEWPAVTIHASLVLAVIAGLLVGVGSRMGSGCTSGHGVMGLARLSPRSMAAVATFLATGIVTITLMRGSL
jgi:uncharacterized membrane protein YedE/YeeE